MQVLRPGARGAAVEAWLLFLRGQGFELIAGDNYDAEALAATKAWQQAQGLASDGIVGMKSYGKAQELGFNPGFVDDDGSDTGPNWPPKPSFAPLNAAGRSALLGAFQFRAAPQPGNPEAIEILGDWVAENIVSVDMPQLAGVKGAPASGRIRLHRLAKQPFVSFFQAIEAAGLKDRILSFGGAWNARFVRGSRANLSNHAYGSAIDLNVPWNGLNVEPARKGKQGCVRELVSLAHEFGLYWGGHFSRPDGMHFELATTQATRPG